MSDAREVEAGHDKVDRHLHQHAAELDQFLSSHLDVEAGLREILLQSRYDGRVDDLVTVMDVEAGLADIVASGRRTSNDADGARASDQSPEHSVTCYLRSVDVRARLTVRTEPALAALLAPMDSLHHHAWELETAATAFRIGLADTGNRSLTPTQGAQVVIEEASDSVRSVWSRAAPHTGYFHACVRALESLAEAERVAAIATARDSGASAAGRGRAKAQMLLDALDDVAPVVRALSTAFESHVRLTVGRMLGRGPVPEGAPLTRLLNDFTDCDLQSVDLNGLELGGVCWSENGTAWPAGVDLGELKARSDEAPPGSGRYVIRSGSATVNDLVEF